MLINQWVKSVVRKEHENDGGVPLGGDAHELWTDTEHTEGYLASQSFRWRNRKYYRRTGKPTHSWTWKIAKALLEESAHYDETTWKTTQGHFGNYSWIKTGVKSTNTLFLFGRSRGKGNAQELCGGSRHIGITDDYVGYDNVFETQALCWAHPDRKIRDLAESKVIYGKAKETCEKMHEEFKKLYKELREFQGTFKERKAKKKEYIKRYEALIVPDEHDPQKLKTYKETLRKEEKKYFTFMDIEGIPMDNNQAERRLRHVVLKRKICLGSKTDKGAKMLEKLYSVVLTWWWKDPVNFISNYRHLLA